MAVMDLVEFHDPAGDIIVVRVPVDPDAQIRMGSQLVVRQSQVAVFSRDGQFLDKFGPGRHTLSTANIPLLGSVIALPYGKTPFKASVYFVGKQTFSNLGWGTQSPIVMRDTELRMVSLRAFGMFSLRVSDELLFLNNLVGTKGLQTTFAIEGFFRSMIVSRLVEALGETLSTILDLPRYYRQIGEAVRSATREEMANYGIELIDFVIEAITPPPEVQEMINKAGGIAAQDLSAYSEVAKADAFVAAANNPGGGAGEGVGAGLGIGLGLGAAKDMMGSFGGNPPAPAPAPAPAPEPRPASQSLADPDPLEQLRKLKIMLEEGLITQEQFEIERQEVLDRM
jgi:membrane protease subunit (stomatin/prohibitin family)